MPQRLQVSGPEALPPRRVSGGGSGPSLTHDRSIKMDRMNATAPAAESRSSPAGGIASVLVADDHFATRLGLTTLLNHQPDLKVVAEAADGREAIELVGRHRVDLALLDIRMPEFSGIEAAATIRHLYPETRLAVLTTFDDGDDIRAALDNGVEGYLLKGTPKDEFLSALHEIIAGRTVVPPRIRERLDEYNNRPLLSARELEIVQQLAMGRSNRDIAADLEISEDTVKTHLRSVFKKMKVVDRTQAVLEALRSGMVRLKND